MKAQTLRNALDAHGWVGLFISIPLFIVFWAGAITLFHGELQSWATLPQAPITKEAYSQDLNQLVAKNIQQYEGDTEQRISLNFPSDHSPYMWLSFRAPDKQAQVAAEGEAPKVFKSLMLDPTTGEVLAEESKFELADFLYQLHYNLKLPQGLYIVGLVTFFFLVLLFTGLVIQLKNLIKHFFLYRKDRSTRYQMQDMHNVVGVITLPYGLMYALTGVMLNLSILMQIPTALILYKGDLDQVFRDIGIVNVTQKAQGNQYPMPDLRPLIQQVETEYDVHIEALNFFNYGDENALIRFRGHYNSGFAANFDKYYQVKSADFPDEVNPPEGNVFNDGVRILYNMHFANFAGVDVRFLYFLVAIGVCGMIIAGNVLWMVKRQKKNHYPKTLAVMRGLTIGGCAGVLPATAFAFLLERMLPMAVASRPEMVEASFGIVLLLGIVIAFMYQHYQRYIAYCLLSSGAMLLATVAYEWLVFDTAMLQLQQAGFSEVLWVSFSLLLSAMTMLAIAWLLLRRSAKAVDENIEPQQIEVTSP